jgi:small subunit ribosomal protein S6
MRRYETFVIVDPDITQEQREPVFERVRELMTQQDGFLVFEDVWGERKMAYAIKKKERGYYVRFDYCGLAPLVNEIERFFRIDDRALKYMTIVLDKDVDLEKVKEEKAAAESLREPEPAPPETPKTPEETKSAELAPEPAAEKQEETVAPEPAAEKQEETVAPEPAAEKQEETVAPEPATEKQEETVAAEPPVTEEAPASETTESAEKTTPVEKKEEV